MTEEHDHIKNIISSIAAFEQGTIFTSDNAIFDVENACAKFLRMRGYRVVEPKIFKIKIKNVDALIQHFYLLLSSKFPDNHTTSINSSRDRMIAKRMVLDRMMVNRSSKAFALNECGEIVNAIMEHIDEFKFKYVPSFTIFAQKNMKWVIDKALNIMNKDLEAENEKKLNELSERALDSNDSGLNGFDDLDELYEESMEVKNGKKR